MHHHRAHAEHSFVATACHEELGMLLKNRSLWDFGCVSTRALGGIKYRPLTKQAEASKAYALDDPASNRIGLSGHVV